MSKDLVDMTAEKVVSRARGLVGKGKYSMKHGYSSMADPSWPTPFDPHHGTGDCIAFALWCQGISRFNKLFIPDTARWTTKDDEWHIATTVRRNDKGTRIPGYLPNPCIWGQPGAPGWINCDSILRPNTLFTPIQVESAAQGDLIVFGSYRYRGSTRPGHIGVVDAITLDSGTMRVRAWHLNGKTQNVAHNIFPTAGRESEIRFLRPYNRQRPQMSLPGVV